MPRRGFRGRNWLSALSVLALVITTFSPISHSPATAAPALVTCVNLQTGTERISHTGKCRYSQEAQANWHKNLTDSPIASGPTAKVIVICSNKESSPVSYQVIRKKCARHQVTTIFSRSGSLPSKPVIAEAVSYGHDSASLKLATDPATSADAPIAFYTITSTTVDTRTAVIVQSQRVYYWKDLNLVINTLQASTRYTFNVTATTVDGTSAISALSNQVTTPAYVAPTSTSSGNSSVAAPAFSLSSIAETKTVNSAISGYSITSTGGAITSYAISPAAPAGTIFNTTTGILSGTPTATQSATAYTITATNASGGATRTFTLTVNALSAPVFSLSSTSETRVATVALAGYTISSTGAAIASYALEGTLPAGLSFSTSTGRITGSATETKTATTYTIIASSASGETSTATYRLRITGDIGDTGPGGGKIFYYLAAGFSCGPSRASTCKFLEVALNDWRGTDPAVSWAQSGPVDYAANVSANYLTLSGEIGYGAQNTKAIVDQGNNNPANSAAALADAHSTSIDGVNYEDWFLPSENELIELYNKRTAAGVVFAGGANINYWSSTSLGNLNGRYVLITSVSFTPGTGSGNPKTYSYYVRPIRAF